MIQAGQQALFQSQNQQVLSIRQSELDYFHNFYGNFGTQSALVVGFSLNTLTNMVGYDAESETAQDIFYIFSTFTFIFAMHTLYNSIFIIVFAPNLALHGPLGSMVRAVDGMTTEQDQVFASFIGALISFTISTAMSFWIIMRERMALICGAMIVVGSGFWYHYCLRIFNRFKMHTAHGQTFEDEVIGKKSAKKKMKKARFAWGSDSKASNDKTESLTSSLLDDNFTDRDVVGNDMTTEPETNRVPHASLSVLSTLSEMHGVEGYMSYTLMHPMEGRQISGEKSLRRYFVLYDGELKHYNSYRDYQEHPERPTSNRPIMVSQFQVATSKRTRPYRIILTSLESDLAGFEFVLDTMEELHTWEHGFNAQCGVEM
jgi:hypothetical protein